MNDPLAAGGRAPAEMLAFATGPWGGADEITVRHASGRRHCSDDSGCQDHGDDADDRRLAGRSSVSCGHVGDQWRGPCAVRSGVTWFVKRDGVNPWGFGSPVRPAV
jgi:hypothetical protein